MAIGTFMTGTAQAVNFGGSVTGGAGGVYNERWCGRSGGTGACGGFGGNWYGGSLGGGRPRRKRWRALELAKNLEPL